MTNTQALNLQFLRITLPQPVTFDPTFRVSLGESSVNTLDSYPQTILLRLGGHIHWSDPPPHHHNRRNCRGLSVLFSGLSESLLSTAQPLSSLSLSPGLENCNWVKWGKGGVGWGGLGEDGWERWKTFFMYPRGCMAHVANPCEKKKKVPSTKRKNDD